MEERVSRLTIQKPFDAHLHLRTGDMLRQVALFSMRDFSGAVIMPNPSARWSVLTAADIFKYRDEVAAANRWELPFSPVMAIKVTDDTTPEIVTAASVAGARVGKVYPKGSTTHSNDGVSDFRARKRVFRAMERLGMILSIHGEKPGVYHEDREEEFFRAHFTWLCESFPTLKIVFEHLSSGRGVEFMQDAPNNIAATITPHHLWLTGDDVTGSTLKAHNYCVPLPKRTQDREILRIAAMSRSQNFFLGTDSAPHPVSDKECGAAKPGIFNAPVAMACLAELFDREGKLGALESFVSTAGPAFYGLAPTADTLTLARQPWTVPARYGDVVPFMAGKPLGWRVVYR